jgi:hypothetical protein
MWHDVSTLTLIDRQWICSVYDAPIAERGFLRSMVLERIKPPRYTRSLLVGRSNNIGMAKFETKGTKGATRGDGAGCRIGGDVLHELIYESPKYHAILHKIFLDVAPSFHPRGLLTLNAYRSAELRNDILKNYSRIYIKKLTDEEPNQYAQRAVSILSTNYPNHIVVDPKNLKFCGVNSEPDGLLIDAMTKRLVIVEAKRRDTTFGEGPSQIVQYHAQAYHNPNFHDYRVSTVLVTSTEAKSQSYLSWEELMSSSQNFDIYFRNSKWV